jgi:hypothetical protein
MKTIKTFYNNQPVIDIRTEKAIGPNFGKEYGLNRDRNPDRDWSEWRSSLMDNAKDTEVTSELLTILVEDLANYYGENSRLFSSKLKEFGIEIKIKE